MASGNNAIPTNGVAHHTPAMRPVPTLPVSVDDAIETIRAYARHKKWSRSGLAKRASMHDTTLRDFYEPHWCPKADTLRILFSLVPPDFNPSGAPPAGPPKPRQVRYRDG
jgi:hypothetical protein